jgi:Cu-processing system ATP-binding protein
MISLLNVVKKFGRLKVLNSIIVNFEKGQAIALIGPNGSGKTTLIKTILGLVIPDSGDILYKENSILGRSDYRSRIGYMPQIGRYPENMSIGQVIDMVVNLRRVKYNDLDNELVNELGVHKLLDKKMRTLSGGTRQKVSACIAFMFSPEVYILDEPTAGLDPVASEVLKQKIIREKEGGKLIILTSHVLSDLDDLVTSVVYMQDGSIKINDKIEVLQVKTGKQKLNQMMAHLIKAEAITK